MLLGGDMVPLQGLRVQDGSGGAACAGDGGGAGGGLRATGNERGNRFWITVGIANRQTPDHAGQGAAYVLAVVGFGGYLTLVHRLCLH